MPRQIEFQSLYTKYDQETAKKNFPKTELFQTG